MTVASPLRPPIHNFRPFTHARVIEARERREQSWIEVEKPKRQAKSSPISKIPSGLVGLPLEVQQQIMNALKGKK